MVLFSIVWYSLVLQGIVLYFVVLCGIARYCLVLCGIVWAAAVQDLAATDWHFSRLDIRSSSSPPADSTTVIIILKLKISQFFTLKNKKVP